METFLPNTVLYNGGDVRPPTFGLDQDPPSGTRRCELVNILAPANYSNGISHYFIFIFIFHSFLSAF